MGLPNLWICFHGYWPERGVEFQTGTFKDLEADAVLARIPENFQGVLTLSSAGNTAVAFARACANSRQSCLIIVPASALAVMRLPGPLWEGVRIVALQAPADYSDAADLSARASRLPNFQSEGGVLNVARRDGMGALILTAVESIGRMPDYYFQAVGSGAGAIAVHEASERLLADGRYGSRVPIQVLSQNVPFAPMYSAWKRKAREISWLEPETARSQISHMFAAVLSTRKPAYGIGGGVRDLLIASGGDMVAVDNLDARKALQLFEEIEGVDIEPAAGVAFASLQNAVREGRIRHESVVLLNITGGGRKKREQAQQLLQIHPDLLIAVCDMESAKSLNRIEKLFHS
jgi:cysteate synthase